MLQFDASEALPPVSRETFRFKRLLFHVKQLTLDFTCPKMNEKQRQAVFREKTENHKKRAAKAALQLLEYEEDYLL
jgi:hypothetical protein